MPVHCTAKPLDRYLVATKWPLPESVLDPSRRCSQMSDWPAFVASLKLKPKCLAHGGASACARRLQRTLSGRASRSNRS